MITICHNFRPNINSQAKTAVSPNLTQTTSSTQNNEALKYPCGFNGNVAFCGIKPQISTYDQNQKSRWYDTYIHLSNEKTNEAEKVGEIVYMQYTPSSKGPISVVDIGSGNGVLSKKMMKELLQRFPERKIKYDAVDNSQRLLDLFQQTCADVPHSVVATPILQDYFKTPQPKGKHDFVIAAHSMYRKDLGGAVHVIQDTLKPGGMAFVIRSNPSSLMNYFYDTYHIESDPTKAQNARKSFMGDDSMDKALRGEDIGFKKLGIPFEITMPGDLKAFERNVQKKGRITPENREMANVLSFIVDSPIEGLIENGKFSALIDDMSNILTDGKMRALNNVFVIAKHK